MMAHLGLYAASSTIEIIIFRTLIGMGYAIATLVCQDYVLDVVPKSMRNRSLGLFTSAMFGGVFAGTAMGGVLADRLGLSPSRPVGCANFRTRALRSSALVILLVYAIGGCWRGYRP